MWKYFEPNIVHWNFLFCFRFYLFNAFFSRFYWNRECGKKEPINFMINYHLLRHRKIHGQWTIERTKSNVSNQNFWPASYCTPGLQPLWCNNGLFDAMLPNYDSICLPLVFWLITNRLIFRPTSNKLDLMLKRTHVPRRNKTANSIEWEKKNGNWVVFCKDYIRTHIYMGKVFWVTEEALFMFPAPQ